MYLSELSGKGWTDEQIEAVTAFFESEEHQQECRDNLRMARSSNEQECYEYRQQQDRGCCGSCDKEITVGEETILVGYNYGH